MTVKPLTKKQFEAYGKQLKELVESRQVHPQSAYYDYTRMALLSIAAAPTRYDKWDLQWFAKQTWLFEGWCRARAAEAAVEYIQAIWNPLGLEEKS